MLILTTLYVSGLVVCIVLAIHSLVMADPADRNKSKEWRNYLKRGGEDV